MKRRLFCKILLVVVAVLGLSVLSGVLFAQGRSVDALARVIEVQERHTEALMARPGVVGTAVGLNGGGGHAVLVLLENRGAGGIPKELEGVPVQAIVTGKIEALSATAQFPRPVPIGVSTGNEGECSAGTIGCRVTDGLNVYALSNNHVFALENAAPLDSLVLQPGRYDADPQCAIYPTDFIGTLADFEPIVFSRRARNEIDAAIALTDTGSLDNATPPLLSGYGAPNSTIVGAYIGQLVQKFGRTTELTKGQVTGVNAIVNVSYGPGKTAKFVKQIVIEPGGFSNSGDSGSLIVTDDYDLNPVGLLFAGSSSHTIANRIDLVLERFGVTIDGTPDGPPPPTGSITGTVTNAVGGSPISGATVSVDTGEAAATAADGTYTITDVPTGERTVTASASGFVSQEKTATVADGGIRTVDFSLAPAVTGDTVSVDSITYSTVGGRNGDKHLSVTVALVDDLGNPVAGASVSIRLDHESGQWWTGAGTTGSDGTVTFTLKNAPSGTYTTQVTDVTAAGLAWDPDDPDNWSEPYPK